MSISMDLSGSLPNYSESDRVFRIFKYGQYIDFETTIFKDSLKVYLISGGLTTELIIDEDFVVPTEFINSCDNDTSRAKLIDPDFDKELISGIQMIRGVESGSTYTVAISYQRLYPNQVKTAYFHNEPLNLTPELMLDVVKSIEQLNVLTRDVADITTVASSDSFLLELDTTKTNSNNYIEQEIHEVNSVSNRFVIHPKGGSFYRDSVTVYHADSARTLTEGTDYFIIGMNEAKTKATSYTAAVYDFILIASAITGTVEVSYHAFGGDPTLDNYRELLADYNKIVLYLNEAKNITEDTLGSTEIMSSVFERIELLENRMRRLQGTPAYGDITSGKCILMKLFSDTPGIHWYTIASLYTTNGTDMTPCEADTFIFRLQSQISHFQFTAAVSVDSANTSGDRFNVNIISENYPRGYEPFIDYGSIDKIIRPQLRVVWNESDTITGAYLQLGFTLTNMLEETVSIEDMSGHESCWKLVEEVATVSHPQDTDFVLPDGSSVWSTALSNSMNENMLIPFKKGHLAWCGSQSMNRPDEGWQYFEITDDLLLDAETDITKFTKLRLDIEEYDGFQFPVDIMFNSRSGSLKGHATFTHGNAPAYINAEVYYLEDKSIKIRLNWDITAGITSNELLLRDVVVFLN